MGEPYRDRRRAQACTAPPIAHTRNPPPAVAGADRSLGSELYAENAAVGNGFAGYAVPTKPFIADALAHRIQRFIGKPA